MNHPMNMRKSSRPNLFISRTKLLQISIFIAFAAIVILPLFTVSSASLSRRVSPNNDLNRAANSVRSANASVSQRHEAVKSLNPADFGLASAEGVPFLALLMQQGGESLATYDGSACTVPKQSFVVGDTVCAKVTDISPLTRRIYWINPDGHVVQSDNVSSSNPSGSRQVNDAGNWKVYLIDSDGALRQGYAFTVTNPAQPEVDLSILKYIANGGGTVPAGGLINYRITVKNNGPDAAVNVQLIESTPNDTVLESSSQDSGPTFTCSGNTCTISSLAAGASATFSFNYRVNAGTANGTVITNTATVSSQTTEAYPSDNSWTASATVSGTTGGGETCSVACPEDIFLQANTTESGNSGRVVHFDYPGGNEECGTITVNHTNDSFFPVGTTPVTATASTGDTCTFNVTITAAPDPGAPTISCPADKTATADSSCQATVALGTPTTTGENVTVTATRSDDKDISEPFRAGTTTVTWTATNSSGTASCEQTVTVNDTTPPTMDTPASQTASADENCEAPVPDFTAAANAQDNCGVEVSQDPAAGTAVGVGVHPVTLTATDNAGNTTTANTTFTVTDTTAPTVTAPADSSASADASCQASIPDFAAASTASDNCDDSLTLTQSPAAGTLVGTGSHTVTVTTTDDAGNSGSDTVVFAVTDNTAPTVTAPADSSADAGASCQAAVPDYAGSSTASDNCGNPTVTQSPAAGAMVGPGSHTVTVTATDSSGNTSTDTVVFTVTDETAPTVTAPADSSADADASCQAAVPDYAGSSTASDNCGNPTVTQSPEAGAMVGPGSHTVTVTATDSSGNTGTDTVVFTVTDDTAPTVTAPADSSADAGASCQAAVPDYAGSSTASDNCGNPTVTQSPEAGAMVGPGSHTVTVTATDSSGNTGTDTVVFTVTDTTAPTVIAPADSSADADANCQAPVPNYAANSTVADNCDTSVTVTQSPAAGTMVGPGSHTVTVTATDDANNNSSDTVVFTVTDNTPPTISCQANITVYLPLNSTSISAVVNFTAPSGTDNCGGAITTQTAGLPSGAAFPVGTTTNTFTVTDGAGHSVSCSFTVTVLYNFTGFFSPVSNPPIVNNVNAGRSIPLKFSLSGNKGLDIFAVGYPASQQVACDSSAPLSELEGTETPGGSTLTYSPDQYHYNWKTEKSWAGTCRQLVVKLNDGTEYIALFKFK